MCSVSEPIMDTCRPLKYFKLSHNWSKFTRIIKVENRKSTESLFRVACLSLNFQEWFGKLFEIWGTDQSLPWVPVELKIRKIIWHVFLIDVFSKPLSLKTKNRLSLRRVFPSTKNPPCAYFFQHFIYASPTQCYINCQNLLKIWAIFSMILNLSLRMLYRWLILRD